MTSVLQGMESNEAARLQTVGDCLRKWAVFITNFSANRSYDIRHLAEVMANVSTGDDIQTFMKDTLQKHPVNRAMSKSNRSISTGRASNRSSSPGSTKNNRMSFSFSANASVTGNRRISVDESISEVRSQLRESRKKKKTLPPGIQSDSSLSRKGRHKKTNSFADLFRRKKKKSDRPGVRTGGGGGLFADEDLSYRDETASKTGDSSLFQDYDPVDNTYMSMPNADNVNPEIKQNESKPALIGGPV